LFVAKVTDAVYETHQELTTNLVPHCAGGTDAGQLAPPVPDVPDWPVVTPFCPGPTPAHE
jgi:hypothetical protein